MADLILVLRGFKNIWKFINLQSRPATVSMKLSYRISLPKVGASLPSASFWRRAGIQWKLKRWDMQGAFKRSFHSRWLFFLLWDPGSRPVFSKLVMRWLGRDDTLNRGHLHVPPILPAHFKQCFRDLTQWANLASFHQFIKDVLIFDGCILHMLQTFLRFLALKFMEPL